LGERYNGILAARLSEWLSNYKVSSVNQAGYIEGERTMDKIFIIKITVYKIFEKKEDIYTGVSST
jgi:hypothetical protein